jgi:hypothetical protein
MVVIRNEAAEEKTRYSKCPGRKLMRTEKEMIVRN